MQCTDLPFTALHCSALLCTALHCTLHYYSLNCSALHCTSLHCTALHCTTLHYTALFCTALHCTALHCTVSLYVSFCIGACISIGREIRCLPYAGFFLKFFKSLMGKHFVTYRHICTSFIVFPMQLEENKYNFFLVYSAILGIF